MEQEVITGLIEAQGDGEAADLLLREFGAIDRASIQTAKSAIDHLQRADPQAALKAAEVILRVCASNADPACAALGLWAKANALRELGEYDRALSCYVDAGSMFGSAGQPVDVASTLIGKIDALMYLSRYAEASSAARRAKRLLLKHGQLLQAAKLDANMGNLFHRVDRYGPALQRYNRARRAFSRLGEEVMVAQVDVNKGNVLTLLDRFSPALRAYQQGRAIFERRGLKAVVAMIDANTGFLFHQRGRFDKALELYTGAATAFRELGIAKNAAVVDLDLAFVYLDLNMLTEGLAICDGALPHFERLGMRAERARALMAKALSQARLGQHQAALQALKEARTLCGLERNEVKAAAVDLYQAVLLLQMRPDISSRDEALELAGRAGAVFRKYGVAGKVGLSSLIEGRIHALKGDAGQAAQSYDQAVGIATRFGLPWLSHQVLHAQGRLLETADPRRAARLYEEAVQVLESMREELRSEGARNLFLGDKLQVYRDLIILLLEAGEESFGKAFQYVERAKSRALVDLLQGELEIRVRGEADPGLLKKIQAIREELNWFYSQLDDGDAKGQRLSPRRLEHIATEVKSRERQLAQCMDRLQLASPRYTGLYGRGVSSLEEVQSLLADDEALIEYYDAGEEILCFVVTRSSLHVRRGVSRAAVVADLSRRLAFQLGKFGYGERYVADHFCQLLEATKGCLTGLYDELLRPIEEIVEDRKLIFVPHGELHTLPFHAFSDGDRWVIQRHEVSYSPSAGVLKLVDGRRSTSVQRCLLMGVADERAPAVEGEIESLRQLFPGPRCLTGRKATVSALRGNCGPWDIVHIASHALFSPGNPMFSRLKLADGWLNVYDIYNLRLDASLVTLSSCQTGVGKTVGSDEIIGISRGFLYAGAASLLSSLWAVNDSSTASLMEAFYRGLTRGESKRSALRAAQLQLEAEYEHPYYWAPFVLIGRSD